MSETKSNHGGELKFILRGFIVWALSAIILLLVAAIIISKSSVSSGSIGYVSSAMSFTAAFLAGILSSKGSKSGLIVKGLILSAALTIVLLTLGYLIGGDGMKSSGILSVVSFTFSGCLLGSVMSSFGKSNSSGKKFSHKSNFRLRS